MGSVPPIDGCRMVMASCKYGSMPKYWIVMYMLFFKGSRGGFRKQGRLFLVCNPWTATELVWEVTDRNQEASMILDVDS